MSDPRTRPAAPPETEPQPAAPSAEAAPRPLEVGGRRATVSGGLEPTRYGDWEKDGRCIDF
jgi:hypothetical protein